MHYEVIMEEQTATQSIRSIESQSGEFRVERNDSHDAKGLWWDIQQNSNTHPNFGRFSKSTREQQSLQENQGEENGATPAPAHRRRCPSTGKRKVHTGPLKKRSPKFSSSNPSNLNYSMRTPLSTPLALRYQPSGSGFLSSGAVPSASNSFRHKLTPSLVNNNMQRGQSDERPVKRNLCIELMKEAFLKTPMTASSTGGKVSLSGNSMPSNSKQTSSITPLPFSFSKKRKSPNPIVTNMTKSNPPTGLFSKTPNIDETPGDRIRNQTIGTKKSDSRPINILRITHPFGNYPRVTVKRSHQNPVSSPLVEVPNTSTKKKELLKHHLPIKGVRTKEPKIEKENLSRSGNGRISNSILFSPVVRSLDLSFETNKASPSTHSKSNITKASFAGKSDYYPSATKSNATKPELKSNPSRPTTKSKSKKKKKELIKSQTMNRPDLFQNVPTTTRPCKCKKTNCLKLYCECFHNNSFCDPDLCKCKDCMNTEAHNSISQPRGPRVLAVLTLMAKRPDVFDQGGRRFNTKGCSCTKSRCIKKFCECYASGKDCSEACLCSDCLNKADTPMIARVSFV